MSIAFRPFSADLSTQADKSMSIAVLPHNNMDTTPSCWSHVRA